MTVYVSLEAFLPLVKRQAPNVADPMAVDALRMSAHRFCVEGRAWRELVEVTVATGQTDIAAAPPYTMLVAVERAEFDGRRLGVKRVSEVPLDDLDRADDGTPPRDLVQVGPQSLILVPFTSGRLRMTVFLAPQAGPVFGALGATSRQANQNRVPEHLFSEWAGGIAAGALFELGTGGEETAQNPLVYQALFDRQVSDALSLVDRGRHRVRQRVTSHFM